MSEKNTSPSHGIRHNILPKLLCLFAAFIMWLYVMQINSNDTEITFEGVRVELVNSVELHNEKNLYLYRGDGTLVDVTVKGRKSVINGYTADDIRVEGDLMTVTEAGDSDLQLRAKLPNGLSLVSMSADSVTVYADHREQKNVDVRAKMISGTMANGIEIGEFSPKYDTVTVTGPKVTLDDIDYAQVKLSLGTVDRSINSTGAVELVSFSGDAIDTRYLTLSRTEMEIFVPVYTYKDVKLTADVKYGFLNERNSKMTVSPETVTVKGDPSVLEAVDTISVATVDEKKLFGDSKLFVDVVPPEGITLADKDGVRAAINITHVDTVTKSFVISDIKVTGAGSTKYDLLTESVTVTLRGTLAELAGLKAKDVKLSVDISETVQGVTGTVTLPLTVTTGIADVYEIGEYTVQISIG